MGETQEIYSLLTKSKQATLLYYLRKQEGRRLTLWEFLRVTFLIYKNLEDPTRIIPIRSIRSASTPYSTIQNDETMFGDAIRPRICAAIDHYLDDFIAKNRRTSRTDNVEINQFLLE